MAKTKSFETELSRLQEIVSKLEKGTESLDESLKLFEEGTKISKFCYEVLDKAEQRITNLANVKLATEGPEDNDD